MYNFVHFFVPFRKLVGAHLGQLSRPKVIQSDVHGVQLGPAGDGHNSSSYIPLIPAPTPPKSSYFMSSSAFQPLAYPAYPCIHLAWWALTVIVVVDSNRSSSRNFCKEYSSFSYMVHFSCLFSFFCFDIFLQQASSSNVIGGMSLRYVATAPRPGFSSRTRAEARSIGRSDRPS